MTETAVPHASAAAPEIETAAALQAGMSAPRGVAAPVTAT